MISLRSWLLNNRDQTWDDDHRQRKKHQWHRRVCSCTSLWKEKLLEWWYYQLSSQQVLPCQHLWFQSPWWRGRSCQKALGCLKFHCFAGVWHKNVHIRSRNLKAFLCTLVCLCWCVCDTHWISQHSHTVEKWPHPSFLITWYRPLNKSPIFTGWYPPKKK